jgi:hypothetical protein
MPAPCTSDDFLALARKSGVVDGAALDAFEHRIDAYPISRARAHWWEIGFRLIGSS